MLNVQVSLDIATSVSVIVAAIGFFLSHLKELKSAKKRRRAELMSNLISDFAKILEDGDIIVEKVRKAAANNDMKSVKNNSDFTDFCISIDRYIRINSNLSFQVWAKPEEMEILNEIQKMVHSWNKGWYEANVNGDMSNFKPFPELIEDINGKVKDLSNRLKQEINS